MIKKCGEKRPEAFYFCLTQVCEEKYQLTLKGELCCLKLLNWSWCWAPLQFHLRRETWSLPSPGCYCMLPTYVFLHSLWPLEECWTQAY